MAAREFVVLVNPQAGSVDEPDGGLDDGTGDDPASDPVTDGPLGRVVEELERHGRVTVIELDDDTSASRAVERAPDDAVLVILGGDGTIHRVLNEIEDHRRPYLLLPGGTGNDFVGGLGVGDQLIDAAALAATTPRAADLVAGPGIHAMNAAHLGIGVQAAQAAENLKDRMGKLAYPTGAVAAAVEFEPLTLTATLDGASLLSERPAAYLAVCNGRRVGGGTPICPVADPTDGVFDVVILLATTRVQLTSTTAALVRGAPLDRDDVMHVQGRELDVTVHGVDSADWNVDGELFDLPASLRWTIQPGAWRVFAPDQRSADAS